MTSTLDSSKFFTEDELAGYTASIDQVAQPYFSTLKTLSRHAKKLHVKDEEGEKKLLEYLPVNERLSIEKESKVLTRWQERQKDWERIEGTISRKIRTKLMNHKVNRSATSRPLMMTTTDEYRARLEEYDLIQSAIPLKDKFSENAWQMTLRGGGPIHVPVGHIFSGLECEIDMHTTAPKMVRKPKPTQAVGKNDTFLEQTDNLLKKRKKYEKNILEIRPHTLTYRDAGNLVVNSMNLFQWAQESSQRYIQQQKEVLLTTMMEAEAEKIRQREAEQKEHERIEYERMLLAQNKGPKLEFLSSQEVVFETEKREQIRRTVVFKNVGTTTLYFRWRLLRSEKEAVSKHDQQHAQHHKENQSSNNAEVAKDVGGLPMNGNIATILDQKGDHEAALLTRTLHHHRESFFCLQECGEILPEETIETTFVFDSRAGGGMFHSIWMLEMTPDDSRIVLTTLKEDPDNSVSNIKIGAINVHLRGHYLVPDESVQKRQVVNSHIHHHTIYTSMQDIVFDCIRHVRTPLRLTEIHRRMIAYFEQINRKLFKQIFTSPHHPEESFSLEEKMLQGLDNSRIYDHSIDVTANDDDIVMMAPLFINIPRIEELEQLHHQAAMLLQHVLQQYQHLLQEANKSSTDEIVVVDKFAVTTNIYNHIMAKVFPEKHLECFDEVEMKQIEPGWGYDLSVAFNALNELRPVIDHIDVLEKEIAARKLAEEKARLKAERAAKRKANGDSDEEDEEEEEEADEEEDKNKIIHKHPLMITLNQLFSQIAGKLYKLTLQPLPAEKIHEITAKELVTVFDGITDLQNEALQAAGILDIFNNYMNANNGNSTGLLTPLPNPFESEDNAKVWETMLALTSPVSEPAVADKKGAKPPAKNAPPPTTATPQQIDFYHKELYNNIRNSILDAVDRVVDVANGAIREESAQLYHPATAISHEAVSGTSQGEALAQVATWRAEDIQDRVVVYSFDGDSVSNSTSDLSIHPVSAFAKNTQSRVLQHLASQVVSMVEDGVKMTIFVYESTSQNKAQASIAHLFEKSNSTSIPSVINKTFDEFIVKDTKSRRKQKIKTPKHYKKVDTLFYKSFAEMYYYVDFILRRGNPAVSANKEDYFANYVPVVFLENLRFDQVVPSEPSYEELDSDDEFPSISIGKDDYKQRARSKFITHRPHRVPVNVSVNVDGVNTVVADSSASTKHKVNVYCDRTAAVQELFSLCSNLGDQTLWIEGQDKSFYHSNHALYSLHEHVIPRVVSHPVREALLWTSVVQTLPHASALIESAAANGEEAPNTSQQLAQHLSYFFQTTVETKSAPKSLMIVGGELRLDKFRVLDELVTLVSIFILNKLFAVEFY